jgi:hypothetical protein
MCDPFFGDCSPAPVDDMPTDGPPMEDEKDMKMDEEWKDEKDMPKYKEEVNPLMGNISYLLTALGITSMAASQLFRYRSADNYYDRTNWQSTNYWKLADQVKLYSMLGLGSVLSVTQILSMLGIAVAINMLAWMLVFPLVAIAVGLTYDILMFIGYENSYSVCESTTDANKDKGCSSIYNYEGDSQRSTVGDLSVMFELKANAMNWWVAQKMALPEDDKKKMDKKMEGDMAEGDEMTEDADAVADLHITVSQAYVSLFNL